MQISNYVTPNIFILCQKSPKSLAAGAPPQTPLGELTALPPDPLAALGWDGDFKTLYPPVKKSWVRACLLTPPTLWDGVFLT